LESNSFAATNDSLRHAFKFKHNSNQEYLLAVANLVMFNMMVVSVTASMLAPVSSFGMYGSLNVSISEPWDRLWFLRMNKLSTGETYLVVSAAYACPFQPARTLSTGAW
jgi:hypothetical protein